MSNHKDSLGSASQLLIFATRHWVWALSEGRRVPCCVNGVFLRAGAAEAHQTWQEVMTYLRQEACSELTFGPMNDGRLTAAENSLIAALDSLQRGYLGKAVAACADLVPNGSVAGLTVLLRRLCSQLDAAGLRFSVTVAERGQPLPANVIPFPAAAHLH